ncbi:DUF5979 domain-containing protein [Nocardioides zeae]|uniref:DUF5979 domain-containing protein n=1 Tax=Nocardioides imazamoxiresistens TaxID=3231893 RepID=A0ABU3PUH6_9ACTN|nr:DUF5979 domain-containing protein [Nocardioides zeae]MDT9592876.1 DUF5979 domain-containing protein [Nocardioides zeae]
MSASARLRPAVRVAVALLLVLLTLALTGPPAQATTGLEVGIQATTEREQASGSRFEYELKVVCTRAEGCTEVSATVPLEETAGWSVTPGTVRTPSAEVTAAPVVEGPDLQVPVTGTLATGHAVTVRFSLTPPTDVLADGTTWELRPTARAGDATTGTTAPTGYRSSIEGSVEAAAHLDVRAGVSDGTLREPGDEVTFRLAVSCLQPETGNLFPGRIAYEAQLGEGLDLVSSEPEGHVVGSRVQWQDTGDERPDSCVERGRTGEREVVVTAEITDEAEDRAELPLTFTAVPTTAGAGPSEVGERVETTAVVTILTDPGASPGNLLAAPFGQLRTSDPGPGSLEDASLATYPGAWLGTVDELPADLLPRFEPNAATGFTQAGFKAAYTNVAGGTGYQVSLTQLMPCLSSGTRHEPSATRCAPAFHPTTVGLWVDNDAAGDAGPALPDDYTAYARLADGSRVALERTAGSAELADGGQWLSLAVPSGAVGRVRAVEMPASEGIASDRVYWAFLGYADEDTEPGDVLVSRAEGTSARGSWSGPLGSSDATLTVAGRPQLGVGTQYAPGRVEVGADTSLEISARAAYPAAPTQDTVVATRLPSGLTWSGEVPATVPASLDLVTSEAGAQTVSTAEVDLPLTVSANVGGSGETVVRAVLTEDELAALVPDGSGVQVDATLALPLRPTAAGVHRPQVRVVLAGTDVSRVCAQDGSPLAGDVPRSATGLDGRATGCSTTATLRAVVGDGSAGFAVTSRVQGDRDGQSKVSPALGLVSAAEGTATYTVQWRNTSEVPLKDVVLYDVLPAEGDTFVAGSGARRSGFDVSLLDVEAPHGVRVQTASGAEVCRSEVGVPDTDGCLGWDDDVDTEDARALRITSGRTYALGEGFDVRVTVAVPDAVPTGAVAWHSAAATARNAWSGSLLPALESQKLGITPYAEQLPPVVTLDTDRAYAGEGEAVTYDLTIANPGPTPITTPAPVGRLPVGLQFLSATTGAVVELLYDVVDWLTGGLLGTVLPRDEVVPQVPVEPVEPVDPTVPVVPVLPGDPGVPTEPDPTTPPLGLGSEVTWPEIELGAYESRTITLTAAPDAYSSGSLLSRFLVEGAILPQPCADGSGVCAEVNVPSGSLTVTHTAVGDGADLFAGQEPATVRLDCVRDGVAVHGFPRTVALADGATSAAVPVPFGSLCSASVTQDRGGSWTATEQSSAQVDAPSDAGSGAATALAVETRFDLARLVVQRQVTGVGSVLAPERASVSVECTWRDETLPGFPVVLDLGRDEETELTAPLPVGAVCSGTDPDGGADEDESPEVQLQVAAAEGPATLPVSGAYSAGRLVVRGAEELGAATQVVATCVREDRTVWSGPLQVAPGGSAVASRSGAAVLLPVGTACTAQAGDGHRVDADEPGEAVTVVAGDPSRIQDLVITVSPGSPVRPGASGQPGLGAVLDVARGATGRGGPVTRSGGFLDGLPRGLVGAPGVPGGATPLEDPTSRATPGADDPEAASGLGAGPEAEDEAAPEGRDVPVLPITLGGLLLLAAGALWSRLRA